MFITTLFFPRGLFLINYLMKKFQKLASVITILFNLLTLFILVYTTPQLKMHSILLFTIGLGCWLFHLRIHMPRAIKFFKS